MTFLTFLKLWAIRVRDSLLDTYGLWGGASEWYGFLIILVVIVASVAAGAILGLIMVVLLGR